MCLYHTISGQMEWEWGGKKHKMEWKKCGIWSGAYSANYKASSFGISFIFLLPFSCDLF